MLKGEHRSLDINTDSVNTVFEKIRDVTFDTDSFGDDGIAVDFGNFVKNNVFECSTKALMVQNLHQEFQYEFFHSIRTAIKEKNSIQWNELLELIEYMIDDCNRNSYSGASFYPLLEIFGLLETALKNDLIGFEHEARIWTVLELMLNIGANHINNDRPTSTMDALTISLNCFNGMSFNVLFNYAIWCKKHRGDSFDPKARQIFDNYLDDKTMHTVACHAVFGVYLPKFYYLDKYWSKQIIAKILQRKDLWSAFWESYVAYNDPHPDIFDALYELYDKSLNGELLCTDETKRAYTHSITHVLLAYFLGFPKAKECFFKFLDNADDEALQHCIFSTHVAIMHPNNDQRFNSDKLVLLWRHKSIRRQTAGLHMWVKQSPLDDKTTIELYLEYLEECPSVSDPIQFVIPVLKKYASKHTDQVEQCLELLVHKQQESNMSVKEAKAMLKL